MRIPCLLTIAMVANMAVGHVCMMPMAFAEAMPSASAQCDHCAHAASETPVQSGGCAGHCLMQTDAQAPAMVLQGSSAGPVIIALPSPSQFSVILSDIITDPSPPDLPPIPIAMTRTVVFLQ